MESLVRGATQFDEPGVRLSVEEAGEHDLEALLARLSHAVDSLGA
jgi:hypothetical protein